MKEVDADLYEFLRENDTGIYQDSRTGQIVVYVHVYFCDLKDFIRIIGNEWFQESGIDVSLYESTIAIELNSIIESFEHDLSSYENCFCKIDWAKYKEKIMAMES